MIFIHSGIYKFNRVV